MYRRYAIGLIFMIAALVATMGCLTDDIATEDFDGEYDAPAGTIVTVDNRNGGIEIEAYVGDKVILHAVKRSTAGEDELEEVDIVVTEGTGEIIIETQYSTTNPKVSVNMEIKVPKDVLVDDVHTSNGAIVLRDTVGNTTLDTSNGGITVEGVEGYVWAETSNGAIEIKDTTGIGDVSSSNGAIDVEISGLAGNVNVRTSNGAITARISQSLDADLDIETNNGDVDVHDLAIDDMSATDQHVTGKLGAGGFELEISSSNGNIDLYKL
jgi:hypothetical protein